MAWEDTPGIPEGRTEEEMQDCTGDKHFVHTELPESGKERGDPGRNSGVIPLGEESLLTLLGLCWQRTRCQILSPRGIIRSSQCHQSTTGLFYGECLLPCCLHLHLHLHKRISYPLDRQTELHKVKTSPLIKVTVKQSNLLGFFLFSQNYGFYLKITWKLSLSSDFQRNLNFLRSTTPDEETFYCHWPLILSCP